MLTEKNHRLGLFADICEAEQVVKQFREQHHGKFANHGEGNGQSHNLNKYIWRFIALSTAQPRVITIEATSEQEARQQSPAGCVMVFAARIRQGVCHA